MIRYFATHPTAANLLMLGLIIIGLIGAPQLKRETFPDYAAEEVEISIPYPGATAIDVEDTICTRVEDAIDNVQNVDEVSCDASENSGVTIVKMLDGSDFSRFFNDIKTEIDAIDDFPDEVETPIVKPLNDTDMVVSLAITGPMSDNDLKAYAEYIKDRLQKEAGISLIDILGFSERQIRIELSTTALQQFGLSVSDVANTIEQQSVNLPAGSLETREREILVRFLDERRTVDAFRDLVIIGGASGAQILLGDVASISDIFEEAENKVVFNDTRAALLQINKTKTEDALRIFERVKAFIDIEEKRAPSGVEFTVTRDVSSIVKDRLNLLTKNAWQGFILVVLTLWLFFNLRFSFWVVAGLPVSFMGALFVMFLIGYSINMITMVGLLIAIGLLMDDAIVIAENVATHLSKGEAPMEAAIKGTAEVSGGVFASFITTVCVFGPLSFISGDIGKVLKVLPVVLILTLLVSLIEAFLILPNHMAHSLKKDEKPSKIRQRFERFLNWVRDHLLGKAVDWAVNWRYLFVGLVVFAFFISVGMVASGQVKFQAFPSIDGNVLEARILLPQGTPLERTEMVVAQVINAVKQVNTDFKPKQPRKQDLIKNIRVDYSKNVDAHETGSHVATVIVDLLNAEIRRATIDDITQSWRGYVGNLPDVLSIKYSEPSMGPQGLPIEIRMQGRDLDLEQLKQASVELQNWLLGYKGVFGLLDDLRPGKPELTLTLRDGATSLGLNAQSVASQLRAAYFGQTADEIQIGVEGYEIDVRLREEDRNSLADIEYVTITTPSGQQVPLNIVAEIKTSRNPARIQRIDGLRTVTVQGDVDTRVANVNEIIKHTQNAFFPKLQERYPGLKISIEGETNSGQTTAKSMRRAFLLGIIGVFVLLSFTFRSYLEPIVVMVAIPFAFIGVIWGHVIMGLDLSMPSIMGFVSLAGIVVNDSILLVTFLKIRAKEGMEVHDAAKQASKDRFRAVLLTSMTTIAGLIPLLSEKSLQAQVLIPLVTSLSFGLLASTLLILIVIPALYSIFHDYGFARAGKEESH